MKRPFLGSAALDAGLLTRRELRTGYRAIYRGVYLANEVALTARLRAATTRRATSTPDDES